MTVGKEQERVLVISDLDGTLLDQAASMSVEVKQAINSLIEEYDVHFTYATSRDYVDFIRVTAGILFNAPIILCNGAILLDQGTGHIIKGFYFTEKDLSIIFARLAKFSLEMKMVFEEHHHLERQTLHSKYWAKAPMNIVSISLIEEKGLVEQVFAAISEKLGETVLINVYPNPYDLQTAILDITPKNVSKGEALKVLKELSDTAYFTVGFGNDRNDWSLLKESDLGVAVGACPVELLAAADEQIHYSEGLSVIELVREILQIRSREK